MKIKDKEEDKKQEGWKGEEKKIEHKNVWGQIKRRKEPQCL